MMTSFLTVSVTESFSDILSIGSSMLNFIQDNPLLMVCFAACLVPIGTKLISGARSAIGA